MASHTKTYFLSPNWDFPPSGPIQMGSLIADPTKPSRSLNRGSIIPIPATSHLHSTKKDFKLSSSELHSGRIGIWATFSQVVGMAGDLSYEQKKDSSEVYHCASLETDHFVPGDKYIFDSLQNEEVKAYISASWWKKPVYMITGLKIAKGFKVTTSERQHRGGNGKAGVDGAAAGAPVPVGRFLLLLFSLREIYRPSRLYS
jgi:hypothetical protein